MIQTDVGCTRLPANVEKRKIVLQDILGPAPRPEELLRSKGETTGLNAPGNKKSDGFLGDVKFSKPRIADAENLPTRMASNGKCICPLLELCTTHQALHSATCTE